MIKYREHTGSLKDSCISIQQFKSLTELFEHICEKWYTDLNSIEVRYYGCDNRVNQNIYSVSVFNQNIFGQTPILYSSGQLVGFIFEEKQSTQ